MPGEAGHAAVIVPFPPELDMVTQRRSFSQVYAAFAAGAAVVVADFTATVFCDCSSLRGLVMIQHRLAASGAELRLVIPPEGLVHRLAELMDLGHLLPAYRSAGEAVAQVTPRPNPVALHHRGGRPVSAMVDVIDLIELSRMHVLRWQGWLGELCRRLGTLPASPGVADTWDTVATLVGLHMHGYEEVCAPAIYDVTPPGRALARAAEQAHEDISDLLQETSLQPLGSPRWWHLVSTTLAAWARHSDYEDHGPPADCLRRADRVLRHQLARQWRAFREARIRDQSYPDAAPEIPTCQLRLTIPATPLLADPAFAALSCTCDACSGRFTRLRLAS